MEQQQICFRNHIGNPKKVRGCCVSGSVHLLSSVHGKVPSCKQYHSFSMNRGIIRDLSSVASYLLVVAKEHLNRQPSIAAYLEPISQVIQLLHLCSRQVPPIQLEVLFNPRISNALGNDGPFVL